MTFPTTAPSFPVYTHARRDQPKVALTFDDGPNPPRTEQVIAVLEAAQVRATFFVIGRWVERWPRTVERMLAAGHLIGNHSYAHVRSLSDYDRAEVAIAHVTGGPSRFARAHLFDYPSYALWHAVQAGDVLTIDSDANPADWSRTSAEEVVRATLDHPSLGNGSIIDLHDSSEFDDDPARLARPLPMIAALARIIDGLRERGYELVGLDELELSDPKPWTPGRAGPADNWPE
jgi:peptidoglycan/xylan/chitin deacetylase (PgdA/CDA1 family)